MRPSKSDNTTSTNVVRAMRLMRQKLTRRRSGSHGSIIAGQRAYSQSAVVFLRAVREPVETYVDLLVDDSPEGLVVQTDVDEAEVNFVANEGPDFGFE